MSDDSWAYPDDDDFVEDYNDEMFMDEDEDEEILQEMIDKYFAGIPKNKILTALKDYYPDYF